MTSFGLSAVKSVVYAINNNDIENKSNDSEDNDETFSSKIKALRH